MHAHVHVHLPHYFSEIMSDPVAMADGFMSGRHTGTGSLVKRRMNRCSRLTPTSSSRASAA